jgi:hypothetical protein
MKQYDFADVAASLCRGVQLQVGAATERRGYNK